MIVKYWPFPRRSSERGHQFPADWCRDVWWPSDDPWLSWHHTAAPSAGSSHMTRRMKSHVPSHAQWPCALPRCPVSAGFSIKQSHHHKPIIMSTVWALCTCSTFTGGRWCLYMLWNLVIIRYLMLTYITFICTLRQCQDVMKDKFPLLHTGTIKCICGLRAVTPGVGVEISAHSSRNAPHGSASLFASDSQTQLLAFTCDLAFKSGGPCFN